MKRARTLYRRPLRAGRKLPDRLPDRPRTPPQERPAPVTGPGVFERTGARLDKTVSAAVNKSVDVLRDWL